MKTAIQDPGAGMAGTPLLGSSSIRNAERADAAAIARTLALAFFDDPWARYCAPRESSRLRKFEQGFASYLRRVWLGQGASYVTADHAGAAIWRRPGAELPSLGEQLKLLPGTIARGGRETVHFLRSLAAFEEAHPSGPHYYLPLMGVVPQRRERGLGHALLQPILERCDRENLPAYLEATNPRCIHLYERNGFRVLDERHLPKGGPPFWPMWRDAPARRNGGGPR